MEVLLVQFLVLAFTGVLWWLARRDLASRAAPVAPPADPQELEQLCATLEALVTDLARRLATVEQRLRENAGASNSGASNSGASFAVSSSSPAPPPPVFLPEPPNEPENAAHAALYALLEEGVSDPAEIARRTGLGRAEADLIVNLRARRAL